MGDLEKFYDKALKFLSYRPRSEKEVRDRLKLKTQSFGKLRTKIKIEESIIEKIIAKLKEKKFINDEEFAKGWIESRLRFKPRSSRLIKLELRQKGIGLETINSLQLTVDDDLESAKKLIEKRMGRLKALPKQEIYQKLGRYLASKGFNWDTIKKAVDEVLGKGV